VRRSDDGRPRDDGLRGDGLRGDGLRDDGLRDDGVRAPCRSKVEFTFTRCAVVATARTLPERS
jgi:hypothetical protein